MGVTQTKGVTMRVQLLATVAALAVATTAASAYTRHHHKHRAHGAECGARSGGPEGHNVYGDLEGHDCETGKAKA